MDITRLNPTPRWSDATSYNGIIHFVEVPADTAQSVDRQIDQILQQAELTLAQMSSDKSRLLQATIYLTDLRYLALFNQMWEGWLPEGAAPSRACLKVELVDPAMLIEIMFVAATCE